MQIGLRIDVDTFRGTRLGVPTLCRILEKHGIKASFFFSVGPDNMGRHLWRLLRPAFFRKMLRTKATRLYGWDILFKGTVWPGPVIGKRLAPIIRATADQGHEVGLHTWDHHAWQADIDTMDTEAVYQSLHRGVQLLTEILDHAPTCSAVPGWKCNDLVLQEKCRFLFRYNSDCRGHSVFSPMIENQILFPPQIPVTLPTYDEVIGHQGVTERNYNEHLFSLLKPDGLNVLTIHAEVEGIICADLFERFVEMAGTRGVVLKPLGELIGASPITDRAPVVPETMPGREGWVACQASVEH